MDVLGVYCGVLAQQFAFQKTKRCRRLVLAATSPSSLMVPGKLTVLLKMATPRRYKDPDYLNRIAGDIYGGELRYSPELVRQPTLVMAGTDDPIVPVANGRILAKLIPDARQVTVDDGHLFLVTRPKDSADIVPNFLS